MAKINNLYVWLADESVSYDIEVTEHPVEKGVSLTDHVQRKARTISISGEIVGKNAENIRKQLISMNDKGTLCKYVGRTTLSNCIITGFSTSHPNTIWGGCEFSMTLKEVRIAKSAVIKKAATKTSTAKNKKAGTKQVQKKSKQTNVYHKVKKGDTVWALVASSKAPYRNLSRPKISGKSYSACNWVMKKNPSAFSRKNDFKTLQIGKKIIVGIRN